jgi:hypothetical protein
MTGTAAGPAGYFEGMDFPFAVTRASSDDDEDEDEDEMDQEELPMFDEDVENDPAMIEKVLNDMAMRENDPEFADILEGMTDRTTDF